MTKHELQKSANQSTPVELGFYMPAEWHNHVATWMAWPHNKETWPENLTEAQNEFIHCVETIAKGETVCIVASGEALEEAREKLNHVDQVEYFDIPTNDAWIRDYGPTFLVNRQSSQSAAINWRYNGWGEKYPPFHDDIVAGKKICEAAGIDSFDTHYVVEGGALEINDQGDLLTTISCLLNFNRNPIPGVTSADQAVTPEQFANHQADISRVLAAMTGAVSVNWLSGAEMEGDDTDGHIDQQVRFVDSQSVIVVKGHSPEDPQQPGFNKSIEELRVNFSTPGRSLQGMDLPVPPPIMLHGRRLPASYLNFYVCNYGILVPQFDVPLTDARAIDLMKAAFPGRRIIGLSSLHLACGLGSFHCLTQQQPAN